MKFNKFTYSIVLLFLILSIYSNYRYQFNFTQMSIIRKELRNNTFSFDSLFLKNVNVNYPNLTNTTIPLKSIIGAHYTKSNDSSKIKLGLDYLYRSQKENPYIGFSEQLLANYYQFRNYNKDSFRFYARKSNKLLPNNPSHFVMMSRIYAEDKKFDSILISFEDILKRVPRDNLVWRVFLASMASSTNVVDSIKVLNYAKQAKQLFRYGTEEMSNQVHLLADYVIYGKENLDESIRIREKANFLAKNNQFSEAELLFAQLVKAFPDIVLYYEDLIAVYWNQQKFIEITDTYSIMKDNGMTNFNSSVLEMIMISYLNQRNFQNGCALLKILKSNNYPLSEKSLELCKQ